MKIMLAVPKGRLFEEAVEVLIRAGILEERVPENSRKLVIPGNDLVDVLLVKAKDVITYVLEGVADAGIVGYDLLVEYNPDVFSLLDLGFGYCKVVVAGKKDSNLGLTAIRVATKFPSITRSYFRAKEIEPKVIELHGSVELAPITGLSDFVVDIMSTGTTIRENNLVVIDEIFESTSRLIVNKRSFYFKRDVVKKLISTLSVSLSRENN